MSRPGHLDMSSHIGKEQAPGDGEMAQYSESKGMEEVAQDTKTQSMERK